MKRDVRETSLCPLLSPLADLAEIKMSAPTYTRWQDQLKDTTKYLAHLVSPQISQDFTKGHNRETTKDTTKSLGDNKGHNKVSRTSCFTQISRDFTKGHNRETTRAKLKFFYSNYIKYSVFYAFLWCLPYRYSPIQKSALHKAY